MSNRIVKLPSVESFGRLTPDKWLALKNLEESAELVEACKQYLKASDPTDPSGIGREFDDHANCLACFGVNVGGELGDDRDKAKAGWIGYVRDQRRQAMLGELAASERPDRYGHYETAAEYVAQREAMKGIGRALGTKMALRLQQLEQLQEPTEARRIQAQSKAFERVCDILSRHGYQISRWTRTEDLETRLKELDEALSSVVPTGTVDRETLYAISCLQQLRTTLGLQDRKEHGR